MTTTTASRRHGVRAPASVEVLRFAPCPTCHCRKRVLDEEEGVQTLRCLECGEAIRMSSRISRRVHVVLHTRPAPPRRRSARIDPRG